MTRAMKSAATMVALVVLLVLAAMWGWSALTRPFPGLADAAACVETPVKAGETVTADQVTVSVLNAGKTAGLAGRTMDEVLGQGFQEGDTGDTPEDTEVAYAQIWTDDVNSPAVALLNSHLRRSKIVQMDMTTIGAVGVVLVVGDTFDDMIPGDAQVTAAADTTICSPA